MPTDGSWSDDPAAPHPQGAASSIPAGLAAAFAVLRRPREPSDALPARLSCRLDQGAGAHYGVNPVLSRLAGTLGGTFVWLVPGRSGSLMRIADGGGVFGPNDLAATQGLPMLRLPTQADEPAMFVGVLPDEVSVTVTNTDGTEAQVLRSGNAFWVTGSSLGSLTVHTQTAGDKTVLTTGPRTPPPIPPAPFRR